MVQIAYQNGAKWLKDDLLPVNTQFKGEAIIPPEMARRRANGYFAHYVALFLEGGQPTLILGEHPIWRVPAILHLRGFGDVATVGSIDVDAQTGKTIPLSEEETEAIRDRALDVAICL